MNDSPKPKRRWCQFSLKTLLMVMLVFTVTVGWGGPKLIQRAREIEEARRIQDCREKLRNISVAIETNEWSTKRPSIEINDDAKPQQESPQCEILP